MKNNVLFYSGNGNHQLGAKIINILREYLGREYPGKVAFSHIDFEDFPDGEPDDRIRKFSEIEGKTVVFYQSIFNLELFEEALELIWAIKKQYQAAYLIAVIPFMTFRRQDHEEKPEEICRLKMAIDRLKHAGVDEIITVSPHSPNMAKFCNEFGVKIHEVDPSPLLVATIQTYLTTIPIIYAPDRGSVPRAIALAKITGSQVIFSLKNRGLNNDTEIKPEEKEEIDGIIECYKKEFSEIYYADVEHVKNKFIVMVEDEISTGGTANKTGQRLKKLEAKKIIFLAINLVLVPGWKRKLFDNNPFDKVIGGDTIPRDYEKRTDGLIHDISLSELITQELYKSLQL